MDVPLSLSFSMMSGPRNWSQNSNLALQLERSYHREHVTGISMACLTMAPRHRSNVLHHRQMTRAIVKLSCTIVKL